MANVITIIENLLTHGFVEESGLKRFEGFEDFKKKNYSLREYCPIAEEYVYCRLENMEEIIQDKKRELIAQIYEGYKHSHLPMKTVKQCIEFIKQQGFSEAFAQNLICYIKLEGDLYSFPSIYGEPEEDWLTPYENTSAFMKELFSIDIGAYKNFLEELEADACNLGNKLICSEDPNIKKLLDSWAKMGIIELLGTGDEKTLTIKETV